MTVCRPGAFTTHGGLMLRYDLPSTRVQSIEKGWTDFHYSSVFWAVAQTAARWFPRPWSSKNIWQIQYVRISYELEEARKHNVKERDLLEDRGVDGRMESEWILGRLAGRMLSGFKWLRIGASEGLLWMWWRTFGFWRQGVSCDLFKLSDLLQNFNARIIHCNFPTWIKKLWRICQKQGK
jgi:hypothetical protein